MPLIEIKELTFDAGDKKILDAFSVTMDVNLEKNSSCPFHRTLHISKC